MLNGFIKSTPIALLTFFLVAWSMPLHAAIKPVGHVILTNGPFVAIQADKSARSLSRGSEFYRGDRLWTGPRTKAQIRFSDGAIMTLRPDTEFSVDEYEFDDQDASRNRSLFTLIKGGFRTLTGLITRLRPDAYKVKTSYAIVGVRGTTYELLIDRGLLMAAWQGTIWAENDVGDINVGFGQDYDYARVPCFTCTPDPLLQTPAQFQESVDPALQEEMLDPTENRLVVGLLQDGNDARLTSSELASLNRVGAGVFLGSNAPDPFTGKASDGSVIDPIFFDLGQSIVVRRGSASASTPTNVNVSGFTVSLGDWNEPTVTGSVAIQPDALDPGVVQGVNRGVFWITMPPATTTPAGSVSYTTVTTFRGRGSGGTVTGLFTPGNFNANVDFSTGALTGGTMIFDAGGDAWNTSFSGTVTGPSFTATLDPGSTVTVSGVTNAAVGDVKGGFTGPTANAMGGAWDFEQAGAPNVFAKGVFLAQ